ncbi:hypothetical protein PANT_27c00002 [Moesziomyces antarcticus T-34]|uniref:Uncharacterized protein n=1 Tax=Pseudozyma antarctica (strain T-34) TaxID=1151754 RepID=M9MH21_PSEA3|nr:hypothetical protein PANT_27c00002 [Moesziomyces antarcticus T-34]
MSHPPAQASTVTPPTRQNDTMETVTDANDLRQKVLALRQMKKEQLLSASQSTLSAQIDVEHNRLTWFGVDDPDHLSIPDISANASESIASRTSHDDIEDDDADSTVLGHYLEALPLPPSTVFVKSIAPSAARSSHVISRDSGSLYPIQQDTLTARAALPLRRGSSARTSVSSLHRNPRASTKDAFASASAPSGRNTPPGPPPTMPLPPRPTRSSHDSHSLSSRTSSRVSAATVVSRRSSTSASSSCKSADLTLDASVSTDRTDSSDVSDEELDSIRTISNHFPSPVHPSATLSHHSLHQALSPSQPTWQDLPFDTPLARRDKQFGVQGESSSDSALSDVLNLTDHRGLLTAKHPHLPVSVARVGLGPRSISPRAAASSPASEQLEYLSDSSAAPCPDPDHGTRPSTSRHKRTGTMSKSLSELMVALELEADDCRQQRQRQSQTHHSDSAQLASSSRSNDTDGSDLQHNGPDEPGILPTSDSLPSLSSSGSQDESLDDSRGPQTAESSLTRSVSTKSVGSYRRSSDTVHDNGSVAEFQSIYNAYRDSAATFASRFTAPTVRIEVPQGDEISDSELEGGSSSELDEVPRKRNKSSRKKHLGFDEQRASLRSRSLTVTRPVADPSRAAYRSRTATAPTDEHSVSSTTVDTPTQGLDPYAFYEFSPSLPPFMPTGLSPRDLTGRGTWSSIVARASERMRSRQPSIASLSTLASTATGPVSMRQIRASAEAKQRQIDAAHRAREQMSDQFAAMSYRPFAIHDHALSLVDPSSTPVQLSRSFSSKSIASSQAYGTTMERRSSTTTLGYTESIAPSVGEYGSKWPVAVGADEAVGPDDAASSYAYTISSLSRQPSSSHGQAKKYVEFSMQTSPQSTPTMALMPLPASAMAVDDAVQHSDVELGSPSPGSAAAQRSSSHLDLLGIDAPMRRRKSPASLLSMHDLDAELDKPGLWPSQIRAPRLSPSAPGRARRESAVVASEGQVTVIDAGSDEESDLDVDASLEDLAERSGVLDASRGSKRKLRVDASETRASGVTPDASSRPIASIPARSKRISAALDRIRAQQASRAAAWHSSDDSDENSICDDDGVHSPVQRGKPIQARSSLSVLANKPRGSYNADNTSCDSATLPLNAGSRVSSASSKSVSSSRRLLRSSSPDLIAPPSDEEEVLLTEDLELDQAEISRHAMVDDEFDLHVGEAVTPRFSTPLKAQNKALVRQNSGSLASETSREAQVAPQESCRSRSSSMSSVIEIIQEADEILSSTGHSIGHSSGHDTTISDSGGTSGHDPQRPNQAAAEIIRRRMSLRKQGIQPPIMLFKRQPERAAVAEPADGATGAESVVRTGCDGDVESPVEDASTSPALQDTPDTMAGSEIWSSFHADRLSTTSSATTWSYRSSVDAPARLQSVSTRESVGSVKGATSKPAQSVPTDAASVRKAAQLGELPSASKPETTTRTTPPGQPMLRRKSSGIPTARERTVVPKPTPRPSWPLNAGSATSGSGAVSRIEKGESASKGPGAAIRRYQSAASLRGAALRAEQDVTQASSATVRKDGLASKDGARRARYSDGQHITPSKAIRSVGGITPSKLPSLRSVASTSSLRSQGQASALPRPASGSQRGGVPQRLPKTVTMGRERQASSNGTGALSSGLPLPSSLRAAPSALC